MIPGFLIPWVGLASEAATLHGLDRLQVIALIWQESLPPGNPRSYRYEPGFWPSYLKDKPEWTRGYTGDMLAAWIRRCSASYGLMQVLFPTACLYGLPMNSEPEILYQPSMSVEYGCRFWSHCLKLGNRDLRASLLHWNGGGRPAYADEVMQKLATLSK